MATNSELMRYVLLTAVLMVSNFQISWAQNADPDFMRSMGKMYVVIAVIGAIFLGLIAFLITLDRRLTKLENQIKEHE